MGAFRYHVDASPRISSTEPTKAQAFLSRHAEHTAGEWHSPDGLCSLASQPIHSRCGRFTLLFTGAIDNHLDVRYRLRFLDWYGNSDGETLVEGLAQLGPALLIHLRGMFAFAAYDHHKQQLLLARDRLGIQPLHLAWDEVGLHFASERRALPGGHDLSPHAISQMLVWGHLSTPAVLVPPATAGVHSLPAGVVVRFNRDRPHRPVRYWPPQPRPDWGPLPIRSPTHARCFLRAQLERAISEQLRCGPMGCFLSSSFDSAILLALACRIHPGRTTSFSLNLPGQPEDELRVTRQLADHCGADHHEFILEADQAIAWVEAGLAALDQPTADGLHTYLLSRAMGEQGITVALTSLGADELFGGCPSHRLVPWLLRIGWLPTHFRQSLVQRFSPSLATKLSHLPRWDNWHLSLALRRIHGDAQLAIAGAVPLEWPQQPPQRITQRFGQISWAELFASTEPMLLRDSNMLRMACGIQLRFPFLDHQLVETALRMPERYQRLGKGLLLSACIDLFPIRTIPLSRRTAMLPMAVWMRGALRPLCLQRLEQLCASGWLDTTWIRAIWKGFEDRSVHWSQAWSLVQLGELARRNT
ncbi:hypothetical protein KQ306_07685 [Synechococcus sp. CS-1324]|nr:hypothetical protein [Synechococcus sp. CS-1324]